VAVRAVAAAAKKVAEEFKKMVKEKLGVVPPHIEAMCDNAATVVAPFVRMYGAAMGPGALDPKTKELIGLALACALGCKHCMTWHTIMALEHGATKEEIFEVLGVVAVMTGGPGIVTWSETVIEVLKQKGLL